MLHVREKINYWTAPYVWEKKPAGRLHILWENRTKPFLNHVPLVEEPLVKQKFLLDNKKWNHDEYIKKVSGNYLIDPRSGFLIDEDGCIIKESIVFDHYGIYPDKFQINNAHKISYLPEVILFDHYWSLNYFHFYSDVIGKLFLINDKAPQLKNTPLIVSYKLSQTRQFKFFMQFEKIASFNWYIQQSDEIIKTSEAYLLQPMPYEKAYWQKIKEIAKPYLKSFDPDKKIFINRPPSTGRHISNFEKLRRVIIAEGYQIEEMENKTMEEQIALFSSAAIIVSIHGAALANLVYCDPRCKILEVMPQKRINTHYYWLSHVLGLAKYDCLLGDKLKVKRIFYPKGKFYLDAEKTKYYLEKMKGD